MLALTHLSPAQLAWAQTAADLARLRWEEVIAELEAMLPVLDAAARDTDWQSRAADAFNDDLGRLRRDVVRLCDCATEAAGAARAARGTLEGLRP